MTGKEMERAFQLLIEQHERINTNLERLEESQSRLAAKLESLSARTSRLAQVETDPPKMRRIARIMTAEMRGRLNRLVLGNKVTLDLTDQVARLLINPPTKDNS